MIQSHNRMWTSPSSTNGVITLVVTTLGLMIQSCITNMRLKPTILPHNYLCPSNYCVNFKNVVSRLQSLFSRKTLVYRNKLQKKGLRPWQKPVQIGEAEASRSTMISFSTSMLPFWIVCVQDAPRTIRSMNMNFNKNDTHGIDRPPPTTTCKVKRERHRAPTRCLAGRQKHRPCTLSGSKTSIARLLPDGQQ